jgi:hypothetical protein
MYYKKIFSKLVPSLVLALGFGFAISSEQAFAAPLSCNLTYTTELTNTPSAVRSYDPATGILSNTGITIPGRTRAAALSPDGSIISYYDDIDNRVEWVNVDTGTSGFGTAVPSEYLTPLQQMTRMGYSSTGRLFFLLKNNVTGNHDMVEISTTTYTTIAQVPLIDNPTNPVSISTLFGGDVIFDDVSKGYIIDNNGSFFKFNTSTGVATYLADFAAINSTQAPAGLAYGTNGDIYAFTSVSPGSVYNIDLATLTVTGPLASASAPTMLSVVLTQMYHPNLHLVRVIIE